MPFFKRSLWLPPLLLLLVGLLLTACGSAPTEIIPTATTSRLSSSGPTPTPTQPTGAPGPIVLTTTITVGGTTENILTNASDQVLYYRTIDTPTSVCSGTCAQTWPPLLLSGTSKLSSSTPLPGTLSVINDANGPQVAYQGHPLYTYVGDTGPDDTTGQGVNGIWYIITLNIRVAE